jgi:hypothetical protein
MSHLGDARAFLIATVPATFTTTNTFANFMPATPESAVCVLGYDAGAPQYDNQGGRVARYGLQLRVRHQTAETAWQWMALAEAAFRTVINSAMNGTGYLSVRPTSAPSAAAWSNLSLTLIQNYEVMRSE